MATNLDLDQTLIDQVLHFSGQRTKKAAVTTALTEYVQRHRQAQLLQSLGQIDFDPDWDAKADRLRESAKRIDQNLQEPA